VQGGNKNQLENLKKAIQVSDKKTIVFDMENTLLQAVYKKNQVPSDYDDHTYIKLFGIQNLKLYLNYRPYLKEMLFELHKDFEIVLFSANIDNYTSKVAQQIQKDGNFFKHVVSKEYLHHSKEFDFFIMDLNILLGQRDLKDIIVVSNTCGRYLFHLYNGIPVKEYTGNKKDLSLIALTKYLKTFKSVNDVRAKIREDFFHI